MVQLVEYLVLAFHIQSFEFDPNFPKTGPDGVKSVIPAARRQRRGGTVVQGHSCLPGEFKACLNFLGPYSSLNEKGPNCLGQIKRCGLVGGDVLGA